MPEFVAFATRDYFLMVLLLAFSRGMDFLSTRIATPNLVLEGNPIAKLLGWRWGALLNIAICLGMAVWPATAIAVSTMSVLVAARNFQSAWLMRTMGEEHYRDWHIARIQETPATLYLSCLAGNTLLTAAVGAGVIYFGRTVVALSLGMGICGYATAVAIYTLLAVWRLRRVSHRKAQRPQPVASIVVNGAVLKAPLIDSCACEPGDFSGK